MSTCTVRIPFAVSSALVPFFRLVLIWVDSSYFKKRNEKKNKTKHGRWWGCVDGLPAQTCHHHFSVSFFWFLIYLFIFFFKVWLVNCSTQKSPSAFRQSTLYISNLEEGLFVMWKIPFSFSPKWTTNTRWLGSCRIDLFFCSSSIQRMTKRTCWPVDLFFFPSVNPAT